MTITQPRGRPPLGKQWDGDAGAWKDLPGYEPSVKKAGAKAYVEVSDRAAAAPPPKRSSRPPGRAPRGKVWCEDVNQWIDDPDACAPPPKARRIGEHAEPPDEASSRAEVELRGMPWNTLWRQVGGESGAERAAIVLKVVADRIGAVKEVSDFVLMLIMKTMRTHAGCAVVQAHGCRTLRNMADDSDARRHMVVYAGALPLIVAAMRVHAGGAELHAEACHALLALATDADLRRLPPSADPLPLVEAALRAHAGVARVQKWGAALGDRLRTLASGAERDAHDKPDGESNDESSVDALLTALEVDAASTTLMWQRPCGALHASDAPEVPNGAVLLQVLDRLPRLQTLNLSNCSMDMESLEALTSWLLHNTTLTSLDVSSALVQDHGATLLASCLERNNTLTALNLWENEVMNESALCLAKMLARNTALTSLDLGNNLIGDQGISALAKALEKNTTLTSLELSGIRYLGANSQSALAKCLKKNTTLKRLSLASELVESKTKAALTLTLAWVETRGSDEGLIAEDLLDW